jgi:hypothetical protein
MMYCSGAAYLRPKRQIFVYNSGLQVLPLFKHSTTPLKDDNLTLILQLPLPTFNDSHNSMSLTSKLIVGNVITPYH